MQKAEWGPEERNSDTAETDKRKFFLTISNIEIILSVETSIFEIGGEAVPRERFKTLTEQMFYVLLCLKEERCGIDILDWVEAVTGGRVSVGSGTLYHLLEQFQEEQMIEETKVEGRKRSYQITDRGREMLEREYQRLETQTADYRRFFKEERP